MDSKNQTGQSETSRRSQTQILSGAQGQERTQKQATTPDGNKHAPVRATSTRNHRYRTSVHNDRARSPRAHTRPRSSRNKVPRPNGLTDTAPNQGPAPAAIPGH